MRVVMVSKALVVGAYQRKLEELARTPDVALTVVVPPAWREGRRVTTLTRAHTEGYDLVVAPLAFNGQYHLHFYPTLGRLVRALRPDVLHMDEEPYNLATWLGLRAGARIGAAGLFFTWQNLARRYPWPFSALEQASYRLARYAIAGNEAATRVLRGKGYAGPIAVIPQFGVDPEIFSPADGLTGRAGTAGELRLGYAGRLVPEKGVDVLLRACARLPMRNWRLFLRGDGPSRPQLTAIAQELGIADRVAFLGSGPSTEMAGFYRSLDIFVLPSLTRPNWAEQFARVLIEAMACGTPVIGSSSGEIPHVLADAGVIVPEGDVAALSDALHALAGDPARRNDMARRGRARVLARFTQAHVAAATAAVYREML